MEALVKSCSKPVTAPHLDPNEVFHQINHSTTIEEFYSLCTKNETCFDFDFHYQNFGKKYSLLHWTVKQENIPLTKALLNIGVYVNPRRQHGLTPLDDAIQYGNLELVELLVEHGGKISNIGEINAQKQIETSDDDEKTRHLNIKKYLNESGHKIYFSNSRHSYSFEECRSAIKNNGIEVIRIQLKTKGIDPNSFSFDNRFTGTRHAAIKGYFEMVKLLVEHGGEIIENNHPDEKGITTAMAARQAGHPEIAEFLEKTQKNRMLKLKMEANKGFQMFLLGLFHDKNSAPCQGIGTVKDVAQHIVSFAR